MRRIPDSGHIVVIGLGNIGYRVVEELLRQGERVVVLARRSTTNPFMATARRQGAAVVNGDATLVEVLRQANVPWRTLRESRPPATNW